MEEGQFYQTPPDIPVPSCSGGVLQIDPSVLLRFGSANGGPESSPGLPKVDKPNFAQDRPLHNINRPKPAPIITPQVRRTEKKRPMTYVDRLKWLKKCANIKKNKLNKTNEPSAFKSTLERRKALQNLKLNKNNIANGNHPPVPPKTDDFEPIKIQPAKPVQPQFNAQKNAGFKPKFETPVALEEYRPQFPNIQSSITFKCRKCCCTSFESLEMLKVHQLQCSSQASTSETQEFQDPTSTSNAASGSANSRTARQVVLCSACGTYFENWDLFLHMRDVHGRHICLFCLGLFSQPEKLANHLSSKHNVQENYFQCNNDLLDKYPETFYLICCKCELMFTSQDNYVMHECNQVLRFCSTCNMKGAHKPECPKNKNRPAPNQINADYNKQLKKPIPISKPVYDNTFELLHNDEFIPDPNLGFDYQNSKELTELGPLDGLGINDFNAALPYSIPETKPSKINADTLAQLIEEVKNCVSAPVIAPPVVESPPPPVENIDVKPVVEALKIEPPEVIDTSNKVPKLTVKVPKITSEKESSDYTSESEDSDKLTVDLGPTNETQLVEKDIKPEPAPEPEIVPAGDDIPIIELTLDQPLDKYPLKDLLKVLLNAAVYSCIYCNHARKIAVNGKQLGLHFISQHKFSATVDSITAEELMPETIIAKIKACLDDVQEEYVNLTDFNKPLTEGKIYEQNYECFQCYYVTLMHKDLYFHNRKMHQKTILLCIMCKSNFYTYSELICHLCPGTYMLENEISFRCCVCNFDKIPSAFRLMVHLRKRHLACDVCLEICSNQSKLSCHVWKHKLHHLCYRCGIAYRNKPDITKHLFWKHGTESVLCKKCLQKKWPHVYHFCIPPTSFACDECNYTFTKAVYLKVHKRSHAGEYPYECKESNCTEKFISKKLLAKHATKHLCLSYSDSEKKSDKGNSGGMDSNLQILGDTTSSPTISKSKKAKKNKSKDKDNLLIDVNLPELNLSESGSSDDSEPEVITQKSDDKIAENPVDDSQTSITLTDDCKQPEPVVGIWDNFKLYQESLEKEIVKPHVPKHVCESDHDYFLIPVNDSPDVEIVSETKLKTDVPKESPKKKKISKKKFKSETISSSSDSSSDSDTTCSGGTNCSCCSSSGSSSSSSSSDSSTSISRKRNNSTRKDSEGSAVDIMITEDAPVLAPPKPVDILIAESDLDSEESATDEEFYDKHPQQAANQILNEKRSQLLQLPSTNVNNGALIESSQQSIPEEGERKKKIKLKKRKKDRRNELNKMNMKGINIPLLDQTSGSSKITISLQSNKILGSPHSVDLFRTKSGMLSDDKRASKRRRVPNKFYGYSSDEEFMMKPHLPPKLEWRKEDLPSPGGLQPELSMEPPRVPEIPAQSSEPVISIKSPPKESSSDESDSSKEGILHIKISPYSPLQPKIETDVKPIDHAHSVIGAGIPFPRPAGAREAREGESVYCYCRCPYDEVSEMIACDADGCTIEWFHFECVGIMVPPKGKWYCPDCRLRVEGVHK